ncbi:nitroreductase [Paenibacillus shirakamiensis]|uniref:Putative NAD(P)H nitroreductase n=1 Tax=Paenibacillus shirakamiensis TaxID=1265935 RepID=A0ABS4JKE7_9BACL|nr:nitroreductase [Paenibacillus shirakamiensis]MBP2001556.1 nitroreductase [Paenibacillus shirakamiensis]
MNVSEAIRSRRSIGKVKQDEIPQATIEAILEAGIWAPNHRLTQPWRFFVLRGEGRNVLGEAMADIALESIEDKNSEEAVKARETALQRPLRAPVIITVAVSPSDKTGVVELEEYGAVFSAIQNMLLEIHAQGLGAVWRTGDPTYHAKMNEHFGLAPQDKVLGFIYLGVPDMDKELVGKRTDVQEKTIWVDRADQLKG